MDSVFSSGGNREADGVRAQLIFARCRSEPFRRRIESARTTKRRFAGFFGVPISYQALIRRSVSL